MTILGTRAGSAPRAAVRPAEPLPTVLGPDLPGAACGGDGRRCGADIHGSLWDDRREHRTDTGTFRPETPTERAQRHERAILICQTRCPIQEQCLAERIAQPELGAGIWGGQLFGHGPVARHCHCGTVIPTDAHPGRVHCSTPCRQAAWERTRATPTAPRTRTCSCGTVFTGVPGQKCRDCRRVNYGERVCAAPGCGVSFVPEGPQQRYHTTRCGRRINERASKARRRAARAARRRGELGVAS